MKSLQNLSTLALLLCAVLSNTALASTEEELHKQFEVRPGGKLVVDVSFGSIEVVTNESSTVVVDVWRKITARRKADEEAYLKDRPIVFEADSEIVTIRSHPLKNEGSWLKTVRNEAKYSIRIPARFTVNLKTAGGSVSVDGLEGDVEARTSGGALNFRAVRGPVDGQTSGGKIEANHCDGTMTVRTSGGSVDVQKGTGTLDAKTSGGSMKVNGYKGPVALQTSGGSIEIVDVTGRIQGSTSGGSIRAVLPGVPEDVKLSTSGGHITVALPTESAFELDAQTGGGHVSSDIPISVVGKIERSHLKGKANGGGKQLFLRTSGGHIEVDAR